MRNEKDMIKAILFAVVATTAVFGLALVMSNLSREINVVKCVNIVADISGKFNPDLNNSPAKNWYWYEDYCKKFY